MITALPTMSLETGAADFCIMQPPTEMRVVDLIGRLDGGTTQHIEAEARACMDTGARRLLLNCEQLNYISNAGLRTLLELARAMQAGSGRLAVCGAMPQVADMFRRSGFSNLVPVFDNRADAETAMLAPVTNLGMGRRAG